MNNLTMSNCQKIRDNVSSIANSPFLNDSSPLDPSKLIEHSVNDLANMKNQRLTEPSTILLGQLSINFFGNIHEMFAALIESFDLLISDSKLEATFSNRQDHNRIIIGL